MDEPHAAAQGCAATLVALCHAADQADGRAAAALFAADGAWVSGRRTVEGRAALEQHFGTPPQGVVVRHLAGPSQVELEPDGTARAVTTYVAFIGRALEGARLPILEAPFSVGEWHDRLVRQPEGWRVARREVRRIMQRPAGE